MNSALKTVCALSTPLLILGLLAPQYLGWFTEHLVFRLCCQLYLIVLVRKHESEIPCPGTMMMKTQSPKSKTCGRASPPKQGTRTETQTVWGQSIFFTNEGLWVATYISDNIQAQGLPKSDSPWAQNAEEKDFLFPSTTFHFNFMRLTERQSTFMTSACSVLDWQSIWAED